MAKTQLEPNYGEIVIKGMPRDGVKKKNQVAGLPFLLLHFDCAIKAAILTFSCLEQKLRL